MSFKFTEPGEVEEVNVGLEDLEEDYGKDYDIPDFKIDLQEDLTPEYSPKLEDEEEEEIWSEEVTLQDLEIDSMIGVSEENNNTKEIFSPGLGAVSNNSEEKEVPQGIITEGLDTEEDIEDRDTDIVIPKKLKIAIIVLAIICILIVAFKLFKNNQATRKTQETRTNTQQIQTPVADNRGQEMKVRTLTRSNMEASEKSYRDYLIVDKKTELVDNNIMFTMTGTTTKEGKDVRINLSITDYNNLTTGQIVEVEFYLIKVDGKVYTCDTKVVGVIAE